MGVSLASGLGFASIAFGVLLYLVGVAGVFQASATPPGDVGLVATSAVFALLGLGGVLVDRARPTA